MDTYTELDLGYWCESFDDPDALGYRVLDVHIYRTPTCRHFDPDRVSFPTVNASGALTSATITHPWRGRDSLQTAIGNIIIRDRKQKRVEAFTFGGEVTLYVFSDRTYCRFSSPAPFFLRSPGAAMDDSDSVIIEEIGALLARRRAAWHGDDAGFGRRLAAIEPAELYVAVLKSLESHFAAMSVGRSRRHYRRIVHDLQKGLAFLRNQGVDVERTPVLETLL